MDCAELQIMKSILTTAAILTLSAFVATSGPIWAAETTAEAPAKPGTDKDQDSKNQENNPKGPTAQGDTATTGTPQQTKTGDTATTDKPLSNGSPNEGTKKPKKTKHHHKATSSAASQTNTAPSGGMDK